MARTAVTDQQRIKMAAMHEKGLPLATIGKAVNRSEPTVCIELKSPATLAILARIRLRNEDKAAEVYRQVLDSLSRRLAESSKLKPSEAQELEAHAVSLLERGQPTMAELFPQAAAAGAGEPQQMTFEELISVRRATVTQAQQPAADQGIILEAQK